MANMSYPAVLAAYLEGHQQPDAAHVTDGPRTGRQGVEPLAQSPSHPRRVADQVAVEHLAHHRVGHGARQWVGEVRVPVQEAAGLDDGVDDAIQRGAERRVAGGQALGQRHQIGAHGRPVIGGEKRPGATGPAHHLVVDQEHAVPVAGRADGFVVCGGRDRRAGGEAADRLHDEGQHGAGALAGDLVLERLRTGLRVRLHGVAGRHAIAEGGWDLRHRAHERAEDLLRVMVAGHGQRAQRGAVIAGLAADHGDARGLADGQRVLPRELDRGLGRLRAAGDEERAIEPGPGQLADEIGERRRWRRSRTGPGRRR